MCCIYIGGEPLILVMYVDELFMTEEERQIATCKQALSSKYDINYFGLMQQFLGMEMLQENVHIFLGQGKYANYVVRRFQMENCRPIATLIIINFQNIRTYDG